MTRPKIGSLCSGGGGRITRMVKRPEFWSRRETTEHLLVSYRSPHNPQRASTARPTSTGSCATRFVPPLGGASPRGAPAAAITVAVPVLVTERTRWPEMSNEQILGFLTHVSVLSLLIAAPLSNSSDHAWRLIATAAVMALLFVGLKVRR